MSQIVINDIPPYTQAVATDGQVVFGTPWTANYPSDVIVYLTPVGDLPNDYTQILNYPTQYSVDFIGDELEVQVTLVIPANAGDRITITRMTPADRENLYTNTNFLPSMLNNDFGILTLVDQQAQLVNQSIGPRYNYSAIITPIVDTILPILLPNQTWVKNNDNTAIIGVTIPSGGIAPSNAAYVLLSPNSALPDGLALNGLGAGILVNVPSTPTVISRSIVGVENQIIVDNQTGVGGDITIGIADNPLINGTAGMGIPTGTTGDRVTPISGISLRYNTTLSSIEYWDGSSWQQLGTSSATWANYPVNTNITSMTGLTGALQAPTGILGSDGNLVLQFTPVTSAINYAGVRSAATTTNDAPRFYTAGSSTNINLEFVTKGTTSGYGFLNNNRNAYVARLSADNGTGNYVTLGTNPTGTGPYLAAAGIDNNCPLNLYANGLSSINFFSNSGSNQIGAFLGASSSVNYLGLQASATTVAPSLVAKGTDTNIPIILMSKGTGPITLWNGSNILAQFNNSTNSFDSYLQFNNTDASGSPIIQVAGSGTDLALAIEAKGSQTITFYGNLGNTTPVAFVNGTGFQHKTYFSFSNTSASRTVTFKDADGTVAWTTDIPVAATQSDQETATSTTTFVSPGRQQYHPSATKAWVNYTSVTTTTILASYNVSSLTDGGTGVTTVNWTTAFSSGNYACVGTCNNGGGLVIETGSKAAGSIVVTSFTSSTIAVADTIVSIMACGDQP